MVGVLSDRVESESAHRRGAVILEGCHQWYSTAMHHGTCTLFILYINNMLDVVEGATEMFADHTKMCKAIGRTED